MEKTIISAIKNDIAIYAIHTNLDNIAEGVNGRIAAMLGLEKIAVLSEKRIPSKNIHFCSGIKSRRYTPGNFEAGGGHIGNYSECSFNVTGEGTFKAGFGTDPYGKYWRKTFGKGSEN